MNCNDLKHFYIISAAVLCSLAVSPVDAQISVGPIDRTLDRTLERRLPRVDERLESRIGQQAEAPIAELPSVLDETMHSSELLQSAADLAASGTVMLNNVAAAAGGVAPRAFVTDVDPFGQPIEKNVLVLLVDEQQRQTALASGLAVISERRMEGLGLTLLTLDSGTSYALTEKALELGRALPDAAVDYNHLYRLQQAPAGGGGTAADEVNLQGNGLRIGMIDSAVKPDHPALRGRKIKRHDFVSHEAGRPLGHGTAVASLLVNASDDSTEILAASVFFQLPQHAPGASTESLVAALDWLAKEDVDAINMSLAGPANALLQRALEAIARQDGPAVIAAVGNNGPSGEPMYPGAYDSVIGVTAVDRDGKIFRYANRGEHVDFAALGVNVKIADAAGSFRLESGTSMAAPRVAALVAALMRRLPSDREALLAALKGSARDLGQRGFDPVFGHGLLTALPSIAAELRTSPQE